VADSLERMADSDERLRMVTVTAVECTPDLRQAVVYLSSLPEAAAEALSGHRSQLQRAIGRQVRMKRTPQLAFAADPGVAHGSRVEEILRHIHQRDVQVSDETTPDGSEDEGRAQGTTDDGTSG
jgi:ribosome-binding factor A